MSKNIVFEIKRIISLQQQAIQNEDLSSAKMRKDRIQRAIHLISSNKEKIVKALQNDFGYKEVFSRQLETLGDDGDTLICYSTSGKSENILSAIQKANTMSTKVILFTALPSLRIT